MKRVLFIMLCICLPFAAGECFAQRYLPGQKGIQLMLGGVDDFGSNVKHLRGNFQLGVAPVSYTHLARFYWISESISTSLTPYSPCSD